MTPIVENPGTDARHVLIIKLSALGDFVMSLGGIEAVRRAHPNAEITLLTTPFLKEFAEACPFVDKVHTNGRPKGLRENYRLLNDISRKAYDIVYDFQTSGRTNNYWKFLKRLPVFRAPVWSGAVEGQEFFHTNPLRHTLHPIDRIADQLRHAGLELLTDASSMPDLSWVRRTLGNTPDLQPEHFSLPEKYALLIPGATAHRSAKRWPEDRYAALATNLLDRGITPVVIGGPAERNIAADISLREPRTINLVGRTSLFQIVTLAERALMAIGNDTGPMHMSTLAGAKGVALFATDESDPVQARPRGAPVKTIAAPTAGAISIDRVIRAIDVLQTHGMTSRRTLLEALVETDYRKCEARLNNGTVLHGWITAVGEDTFEFRDSGPMAQDAPLYFQIEDLDRYSLRYWIDTSPHPIDLLVS